MSTKAKKNKNDDAEPKSRKQVIKEELKFIVGLLAFLLIFFNFIFGHFKIPSESMQPTLEVGDHLYVNKMAYGWSKHSLIGPLRKLPLKEGRIFGRQPKRGDVIVFRNPKSGQVMIKRLIGLPGDKVLTRNGRLFINGEMIDRKELEQFRYREHSTNFPVQITRYEEHFDQEKRKHQIYERDDFQDLDNAGVFTIQPDKLFFMGDNRDNSTDSRAKHGPGLVPFDHVIGRAEMMVYSFKKCEKEEGIRCPGSRWFLNL